MSAPNLLRGFVLGGFRSFHGDPQFIGPLDKITVVAGPNNSGKSNILLGLQFVLPLLRGEGDARALTPLDGPRPSSWEPGSLAVDLVTGVGLAVEDGVTPVQHLIGLMPGPHHLEIGSHNFTVMDRLAKVLLAENAADDLMWILMRATAGDPGLSPDSGLLQRCLAGIEGYAKNISDVCLTQFGSSGGSATDNIAVILRHLVRQAPSPRVVPVPPQRVIVQQPGVEALDPSGRGLPGILQRLQAPQAESYYEDTRQLANINRFIGVVLEDESAHLLIPHDGNTIHLALHGKVLPLRNLGAGIGQVVLLATIATLYREALVAIEEPENDLHPTLLRRVIKYLAEETSNQYLITTHSAHLLDAPQARVLRVENSPSAGTVVASVLSPSQRFETAGKLGYRASDLLQSNCVIWVEGPSDRIYLTHWMASLAEDLVEGAHFSVMFYGGRLLSHLSGSDVLADDEEATNLIRLLPLNRNMAIVIDSDRKAPEEGVNATKSRIVQEFSTSDAFAWVTAGREIENYVPGETFRDAVAEVHGVTIEASPEPYTSMFAGLDKRPDKVAIAQAVVARTSIAPVLDLSEQLEGLIAFVRKANGMV